MDDLVNSLSNSFEVTSSNGLDATKAPRLSQWKEKTSRSGDQKRRRESRLKEIKASRQKVFETSRNLDEEVKSKKASEKRIHADFKNLLMQSEWLVDVPAQFDDWCVAVCPLGRRRILNAQFGRTCLYNKGGYETKRTWSKLPGGSRGAACPSHQTLLDGIHCEATNSFYVLDILAWDGYHVMDCDFTFRKFWLDQKMAEFCNDPKGGLRIKRAPTAEMAEMEKLFALGPEETLDVEMDDEPPMVDGILFYHKDGTYQSGTTPLVGWLKPEHMADQFPSFTLHQHYLLKPLDDRRKQFAPPEKLLMTKMI